MSHARSLLVLCLAALLVTACGTSPVPTLEAKPAKDILDPAVLQPKSGAGIVFVKRDSGATGAGCVHRIMVDGKPVADLWAGEMVRMVLQPGEHLLLVQNRCLGIPGGDNQIEIVSDAARERIFRTAVQANGSVAVMPTSF